MRNKISLLIYFSILSISSVFAQQINITGRISDSNHNPLEYANVRLLNQDSVFIKGTTSDRNGKIRLQAGSNQSYLLLISNTGYTSSTLSLKDVRSNIDLGEITLEEASTLLDSVVVSGNRTIHKIDRQIAFPNQLQQNSSNNALDLLYKMALPRVVVNSANRTISLIGNETILLRINGVNASVNEIAAIQAKDIVRIEYYDIPGIQFNESAMIDFIVKRRESGGSVSADLTNSPHIGFGNDMFTTKFNHKNSEWSALYFLSYRDYKKREIESNTVFKFPGEDITMQSIGIPSPFSYQTHNLNLTYNYTLPNKRVLNITMAGSLHNNNGHDQSLNEYSNESNRVYPSSTESKSRNKNPIIDIYYKETLSRKQILLFNVVGGYINSKYTRNYQEENSSDHTLSTYFSNITGNKYSIIGEGVHQMRWEKCNLNSGIKYNQGYAENKYMGTISESTSLKNSDLYIYTQMQGKMKALFYGVGIGVSYSSFSDQKNRFDFWTARPFVSLAYSIKNQLFLQYMFNINPYIPSLSSLSDVSQIIDQYQASKGNPNLKPYRIYTNQLRINYQKNLFQCNLGVSHQYFKNAIMQDIYFDQAISRFIFSNINQKYYQNTAITGGINWQLIKEILSLNLNGQISWMRSEGHSYSHKFTSYFYGGQLNFNLKQWTVNIGANSRYDNLWGETINYGEWWSTVEVSYKYKELNIGILGNNFLTNKWSAGNKNLSALVPSTTWTYIYDSAPIFCLHLTWNFSWGKQSKAGKKVFDNKDSDSGILKIE